MRIGGNVTCKLMTQNSTKNEIGERVASLEEYVTLHGWLDFVSEMTERQSFNAKLQESTHVFLCDYVEIGKGIRDLVFVDNKGREYDILHIDNPMNLDYHLEIFLKYVGD